MTPPAEGPGGGPLSPPILPPTAPLSVGVVAPEPGADRLTLGPGSTMPLAAWRAVGLLIPAEEWLVIGEEESAEGDEGEGEGWVRVSGVGSELVRRSAKAGTSWSAVSSEPAPLVPVVGPDPPGLGRVAPAVPAGPASGLADPTASDDMPARAMSWSAAVADAAVVLVPPLEPGSGAVGWESVGGSGRADGPASAVEVGPITWPGRRSAACAT